VKARSLLIAVCGASKATEAETRDAEAVGRLLAQRGAVVICGGLGGVMAAVARGAGEAGGVSIGLLPGSDRGDAAPDLTFALPTGLGEVRNALIARCSEAMIAIGGGYGTLSEVGLALRLGRRVAALRSWELRRPDTGEPDPALHSVDTPLQAVDWVLATTDR
jgi:uncharacterized protein (TIGR00725 family)